MSWQAFKGKQVKVRVGPLEGDTEPLFVDVYVHHEFSISDAVAHRLATEVCWEDVLSARHVINAGGPTAAMLARLDARDGGSYTYITMKADLGSAFRNYAIEVEPPEVPKDLVQFFARRRERIEEADERDSRMIREEFGDDPFHGPRPAKRPRQVEDSPEADASPTIRARASSPSLGGGSPHSM